MQIKSESIGKKALLEQKSEVFQRENPLSNPIALRKKSKWLGFNRIYQGKSPSYQPLDRRSPSPKCDSFRPADPLPTPLHKSKLPLRILMNKNEFLPYEDIKQLNNERIQSNNNKKQQKIRTLEQKRQRYASHLISEEKESKNKLDSMVEKKQKQWDKIGQKLESIVDTSKEEFNFEIMCLGLDEAQSDSEFSSVSEY